MTTSSLPARARKGSRVEKSDLGGTIWKSDRIVKSDISALMFVRAARNNREAEKAKEASDSYNFLLCKDSPSIEFSVTQFLHAHAHSSRRVKVHRIPVRIGIAVDDAPLNRGCASV